MYYPKSKIIENLYTDNSDFIYLKNNKTYKGYYYSTYDGKYFTGKTYSQTSEELVKLVDKESVIVKNHNNNSYTSSGGKAIINNSPRFKHIIPTESDYKNGYFKRYFCNRVNGDLQTILEIEQKQFDSLKDNLLYTKVSFNWKISGNIEDTQDNNIFIPGVVTTNINTLKTVEKQLSGISSYINNPSQFYK